MPRRHQLELLAPARDADIGIEAVNHGADAVYIGGPGFGARVGGYGFRHADGSSDKWDDCRMNGVGVFGLSFYESNTTKLKVATINGVTPSVETVASAEYPVSRPLFFYVKKDHIGVIPGLKEYAEFFVSDAIAGPGGPLSSYGLVPDPELATVQQTVADEAAMQ